MKKIPIAALLVVLVAFIAASAYFYINLMTIDENSLIYKPDFVDTITREIEPLP